MRPPSVSGETCFDGRGIVQGPFCILYSILRSSIVCTYHLLFTPVSVYKLLYMHMVYVINK